MSITQPDHQHLAMIYWTYNDDDEKTGKNYDDWKNDDDDWKNDDNRLNYRAMAKSQKAEQFVVLDKLKGVVVVARRLNTPENVSSKSFA